MEQDDIFEVKYTRDAFECNYRIILFDDQNGPSTFEKSSAVHAEAFTDVTPAVQVPHSHHTMDNQPVNFSEQKLGSSQEIQNLAPRHNSNRVSSIPQAQMRPLGTIIRK